MSQAIGDPEEIIRFANSLSNPIIERMCMFNEFAFRAMPLRSSSVSSGNTFPVSSVYFFR